MTIRELTLQHTRRGGKRQGAGRPLGSGRYGEPTKAIRIPQSLVSNVREFLTAQQTQISSPRKLPLYGHKIAAGRLSATDDHISAFLDLNEHLAKHPESTFLVRVEGDSMIGAGIHANDLLVVDHQLKPQHGHIIIAAINTELTVKRLRLTPPQPIQLVPENDRYPIVTIDDHMNFHICGVVTNVIHCFLT